MSFLLPALAVFAAVISPPALADPPVEVLLADFEPAARGDAGFAALLSVQLARELEAALAIKPVLLDDAPPMSGASAALYIEACPEGDREGCALVVGQNALVDWTVTGRVERRDGELWLEVVFLDMADTAIESYRVSGFLEPGEDAAFVAGVVRTLDDLIAGEIGGVEDIRAAPEPEEGEERLDPLEAALLASAFEGILSGIQQVHGVRRSANYDEGVPEWDARSRRADLVLSVAAGPAWGDTSAAYRGELLWDDDSDATLASLGVVSLQPGLAAQGSFALGIGLAERLDLQLALRAATGRYTQEVETSVVDAASMTEAEDPTRSWALGTDLSLHHLVPRGDRLHPFVELGGGLRWLPLTGAQQRELPSDLPRFQGFLQPAARVSVGAVLRAGRHRDLSLGLPLTLAFGHRIQGLGDGDLDLLDVPTTDSGVAAVVGLELCLRRRLALGPELVLDP